MPESALLIAIAVGVLTLAIAAVAGVGIYLLRTFREMGSDAERATYRTLHHASRAGAHLRTGLDSPSLPKALRHLRLMLGCEAIAVLKGTTTLGWDGSETPLDEALLERARAAAAQGQGHLLPASAEAGASGEGRGAVVVPVVVDGTQVAALMAVSHAPGAGLMRAATEVGYWLASVVELSSLEENRRLLVEAELKTLRAQISPHFIYNSLNAIASFITTDPHRARELVLEFADFTRYSFRRHGDFTTLAEELQSIDRYLLLERARFGERLSVSLRIAPEVLSTILPFLSLQPLVENALRHGIESRPGQGRISIEAYEEGNDAVVRIEDDGIGMDPELLGALLADRSTSGHHVGLRNVDLRLRQVYGNDYGLLIDTAPEEGMLITLRIPKSQPGHEA